MSFLSRLLLAACLLGGFYAGYSNFSSPAVRCAYAEAGKSCEFCPPAYCHNPEAARELKEAKKARARAEGMPERYLALWDRLDDCIRCVRDSPDWVHIMYVYDKDVYKEKRGEKAPFDSHSLAWSADLEKKIREEMREGIVKEFHIIHYSNKPCICCRARSKAAYEEWFEGYDMDDFKYKDYNKEHDFHPDAAISFTDVSKLGPDPADLTTMAEQFKRNPQASAPPAEKYMDPAARLVHVICDKCRPLEEEYNKYARYINEQRRPLAQARRSIFFARQALSGVEDEQYGMGRLARTPETIKKSEELDKEWRDRREQLSRARRKLQEMLEHRAEWEAKLAALMPKILECEESCTTPAEDAPKAALKKKSNDEEGKNQHNTLPDNKTKPVPVKDEPAPKTKAGNKSGCAAPKAPSIAIGPNDKYGTSAANKQKAADTAKGALMGAIGGFGGGGGVKFGGGDFVPGGGGGSKKGPKTVSDPVSSKYKQTFGASAAGTVMKMGAAFTDKGLTISSKIDSAPGDGTFHAVYAEDCKGNKIMPNDYLIFDVWQSWSLNLWWTHDRYVNGQHVLHEEGEEFSQGMQKVGTLPFYKKGNEANGIWNRMGYDQAVGGVRGLGTVFNIKPEQLAKGPINLVVHTTLPKGDIVKTDPQIFRMSLEDDGRITLGKIK